MYTRDAFGKYLLTGAVALAVLASFGTAHARFTVLHTFTAGSDGAWPTATLIKDKVGNLYGTTFYGGGTGCYGNGCGTVFELAPNGTETILYAFTGGSDGANPVAGLIEDSAGNFYGTTIGGGTGCNGIGCGTVFMLAPDGTETVLHAFTAGSDGAGPIAGLIRDKTGNLYGTTAAGGNIEKDCTNLDGCGTVFKLAPDGTESVLYAFTGGNDGSLPYGGLLRDKSGNLYGTTQYGGGCSEGGMYGCGTVFELAPDGAETVLHAFTGGNDGATPEAGLIADSAGNLYGTTSIGGGIGCGAAGCGTVFELAANGTETVLHAFAGGSDGAIPEAGLVADSAGNFYGTTGFGGSGCRRGGCGPGTVFEVTPVGTETVLHTFRHKSAAFPGSGLIMDRTGKLYGTTTHGGGTGCGGKGCGTVFSLKP